MTARVEDMFRDIMDSQTFWFPVFGEIKRFANGTIDVQPKVSLGGEEAPVLKGIPIILPGGGGWKIDFKPAPGDLALLIFCGQNVFQFWNRSKVANAENKPSLMDAVAIPFSKRTSSAGVTISNESETVKVELKDTPTPQVNITAAAEVNITSPAVKINGDLGFNVVTHTHTVSGGVTGPPTVGT